MKIQEIYESFLGKSKIGIFIIENNNDTVEIYDENEQSVCWFDKNDLPILIKFLEDANK